MRKVFVGIPTMSGQVWAGTAHALFQAGWELAEQGATMALHWRANDSLLPQARNVIVGSFLASDCTDLICIDADISWGPGAFTKLLSHKADFVAGCYRYKREPEEYPVRWLPKPMLIADPESGLLEVEAVPFGFVRLTRSCCERMVEARKDFAFTVNDQPDVKCWALFDVEWRDGAYHGEDFAFCKRWRDIGGKVWVDPGIELAHYGGSRGYAGSLGGWLRARKPEKQTPDPAKADRLRELVNSPEYDKLIAAASGETA